jgi:hypothetical protein
MTLTKRALSNAYQKQPTATAPTKPTAKPAPHGAGFVVFETGVISPLRSHGAKW